jgi:hypothetical protein
MKTNKIFCLLILLAVFGIAGCKKDSLLNQTPPTALADASYWHTVSDLQNYMNNLYGKDAIFPHYRSYSNLGIYSLDGNSDNMVPVAVDARLSGQYTVASNGTYADYTDIRDVNYFLVNYRRVTAAATDVAPYVGEAYFFRAILYFYALEKVGGVPWVNQPLDITDTQLINAPRLARNTLVDSIVNDLDRAITNLPTKSKAQSQRLYKEYAQSFKVRVCLYEGTWEKYHAGDAFGVSGQDGSKYIQLAATTASDVINSNIYALDNVGLSDGYFKLFNQTDYSSSKEIVFWGAYNQQAGVTTYWQNYFHEGSAGTASTGMSKSLVDDYLCTDGNPAGISPLYKGDDSLKHIVQNRDPRLRQSLFLTGDTVAINVPGATAPLLFAYPAFNNATPCTTGFQIRKGLNTDALQDSHYSAGGTDGVIYMRYAEILLDYAEARAELGQLTQGDVDITINKIRDRVKMPHLNVGAIPTDPHWLFPALSPVINEIRRERHIELACEGLRLDDMMRWAAAPQLIINKQPLGAQVTQFLTVPITAGKLVVGTNIYINANGYIEPYQKVPAMANGYAFNPGRDYLFPITLQETVVNTAIKQNPGW